MRGGSEKLCGGLNAVAEGVNFFHVEHHECAGGDCDYGVENADDEERR